MDNVYNTIQKQETEAIMHWLTTKKAPSTFDLFTDDERRFSANRNKPTPFSEKSTIKLNYVNSENAIYESKNQNLNQSLEIYRLNNWDMLSISDSLSINDKQNKEKLHSFTAIKAVTNLSERTYKRKGDTYTNDKYQLFVNNNNEQSFPIIYKRFDSFTDVGTGILINDHLSTISKSNGQILDRSLRSISNLKKSTTKQTDKSNSISRKLRKNLKCFDAFKNMPDSSKRINKQKCVVPTKNIHILNQKQHRRCNNKSKVLSSIDCFSTTADNKHNNIATKLKKGPHYSMTSKAKPNSFKIQKKKISKSSNIVNICDKLRKMNRENVTLENNSFNINDDGYTSFINQSGKSKTLDNMEVFTEHIENTLQENENQCEIINLLENSSYKDETGSDILEKSLFDDKYNSNMTYLTNYIPMFKEQDSPDFIVEKAKSNAISNSLHNSFKNLPSLINVSKSNENNNCVKFTKHCRILSLNEFINKVSNSTILRHEWFNEYKNNFKRNIKVVVKNNLREISFS